ncbi:MAG: hypothetical protein QOF78_4033 [Phycisphaerales bacterium]|nr:hypothetical protein [Phycisphaerales bacterium]
MLTTEPTISRKIDSLTSAHDPAHAASFELQRFAFHGSAIGISSAVKLLAPQIEHLFGDFRVKQWPPRVVPVTGTIWPYEQSHVLKHLSPTARRVGTSCDLLELYEDEERFWLVDDRWGIAEMNLLKGQWRSWVLPKPAIDAVRVAEMAILWPMAQLLRARGIYLVPAASVAFMDRSFLLLAPFGIEPELTTLIRGGYRIIGQSWTAIREHDGRFALLNLPGQVERAIPPGMRLASGAGNAGADSAPTTVDLMREFCGVEQREGWCDAILIASAGRRADSNIRPLDRAAAAQVLRRAWPIFELHPSRRHGQLPARLAQKVPCYQLTLSREPRDILRILGSLPTPITSSVVHPLRAAG